MLPLILAVFAFCFILERTIPGWRLPRVETWPLRVIAINIVQLGIVVLAGLSWERWLSSRSVSPIQSHPAPPRRIHRLLHCYIRLLLVASLAP